MSRHLGVGTTRPTVGVGTTRSTLTAVLAGLALAASGCGSSSDEGSEAGSEAGSDQSSWVKTGTPSPEPSADDELPEETSLETATETPSETPSETPTEATTDDPVAIDGGHDVAGTGYTFQAPKGWGPPPQEIPGFDPDSWAFNLADKGDGFMENINVVTTPGELTPAQLRKSARLGLGSIGVTGMDLKEPTEVAGALAVHVAATTSLNTTSYWIDQFYFSRDRQTYIVTFSFDADATPQQRVGVHDPVLASWAWDA